MTVAKKAQLADFCVIAFLLAYHSSFFIISDRFFGFDTFFHFALAREVFSGEIFRGISHLPLTVLGNAGPDHHLLFHIAIAPFTLLESSLGLKVAAAFFAIFSSVCIYYILKALRIPFPQLLMLLLLASSASYTMRISMLRVQSIAVPMVLLALLLLLRERKYGLAILGFLFSWTYHGSIICAPLAAIVLLSTWLTKRKIVFAPIVYLACGMMLGQLINPFVPDNFEFLFFHVLFSTSNPLGLKVGNEWASPSLVTFFGDMWILHLAMLATFLLALSKKCQISGDTLAFTGVWLLFLVMTLKHVRFIEYWIPVSVVLVGLLLRDITREKATLGLRAQTVLAILFGLATAHHWRQISLVLPHGVPENYLKEVSAYLSEHSGQNEIVLNLHWDQFPLLYYHNKHNRYVTGLDPNFLAYASPEAHSLLNKLRSPNYLIPNIADKLETHFQARYVLGYPEDNAVLARYSELQKVQQTKYGSLWKIKR